MARTRRGKATDKEPIAVTRRVIKSGRSFYISIPPEFIEKHRLQKGDAVPIVCDTVLKVIPCKEI
jgi:antitoxin component of MazEF toxin-antitoxin module